MGAFHRRIDLRVQAFHHPVRHPGVQEVDDVLPIALERPRRLDHRLKPAVRGPEVPPFQVGHGFRRIGTLPKSRRRQFDLIRPSGAKVQPFQRQPGFLCVRQVLGVLQPEEPALDQGFVVPLLLPPDHLERLVQLSQDVKPVEHDQGFFQERPDSVQIRIPHVAANDIDLAGIDSPLPKVLNERLDEPLFSPFSQENDQSRLEIIERRHVDVALADRKLVDAQLMEGPQADSPSGPLDVMLQNPPQPIGRLVRQFRNRGHRHLPAQRQD